MLQAATCHHTMCRVEVHHADEAAALQFAVALAPQGLFSGDGSHGQQYEIRADRVVTTVYYLAREDQRLPAGSRQD